MGVSHSDPVCRLSLLWYSDPIGEYIRRDCIKAIMQILNTNRGKIFWSSNWWSCSLTKFRWKFGCSAVLRRSLNTFLLFLLLRIKSISCFSYLLWSVRMSNSDFRLNLVLVQIFSTTNLVCHVFIYLNLSLSLLVKELTRSDVKRLIMIWSLEINLI